MPTFIVVRRLALVVSLSLSTANAAFSQDTVTPSEDDRQIDISGELINTEQALHFALSGDRVPNADTVKIERIKTQFSARGNQWVFLFRDEDKTYEATVRQDRSFDLDKEFDEDGENAEFWATLPDPRDVELPETYLERSMEIVEAFNPTYTANPRAIIEYEVCDPPEQGTESDYMNGCRRNENKEHWEVFIQVSAEVRGEEDTFFRAINFRDGHPTTIKDAMVSGLW